MSAYRTIAKQEGKLSSEDIIFRPRYSEPVHKKYAAMELMRYAINRRSGLLEDWEYPSYDAYEMFFNEPRFHCLTFIPIEEIELALEEIKTRPWYYVVLWKLWSRQYSCNIADR